jgi:uncharacterized membrane protein
VAKRPAATRLLPWRFGLFLLLSVAIPMLTPLLGVARAVLVGFDVAAVGFLVTLPSLFAQGAPAAMRAHSAQNDTNRALTLLLTVVTSAVVLVAVALELSETPEVAAKLLVIATLLLAWLFSNLVFALHYAHIYYLQDGGHDRGGLDFPDDSAPSYWDFTYFALTLGMTFQTSDVSVTSQRWRKIMLGHSFTAFVFNIGVIAFTINSLAR